jgi:hypothetical protein
MSPSEGCRLSSTAAPQHPLLVPYQTQALAVRGHRHPGVAAVVAAVLSTVLSTMSAAPVLGAVVGFRPLARSVSLSDQYVVSGPTAWRPPVADQLRAAGGTPASGRVGARCRSSPTLTRLTNCRVACRTRHPGRPAGPAFKTRLHNNRRSCRKSVRGQRPRGTSAAAGTDVAVTSWCEGARSVAATCHSVEIARTGTFPTCCESYLKAAHEPSIGV